MKIGVVIVAVALVGCSASPQSEDVGEVSHGVVNLPVGQWCGAPDWVGPPACSVCDATLDITFSSHRGVDRADAIWQYPDFDDQAYPSYAIRQPFGLDGVLRYNEVDQGDGLVYGRLTIGGQMPDGARQIRWEQNVTWDHDLVGTIVEAGPGGCP